MFRFLHAVRFVFSSTIVAICVFTLLARGDGVKLYGTADRVPKFLTASSIGDSNLADNGVAGFDFTTHQLHNVVDPTSATDAATQAYVLAHAGSGFGVLVDDVAIPYGTNTDNYAAAGDTGQNLLVLLITQTTGFGNMTLSGVAGGTEGRLLVVAGVGNPSGYQFTILSEQTSSLAQNRFAAQANVDGQPVLGYHVIYTGTGNQKGGHAMFVYHNARWWWIGSGN